jgi:thiol:disulfide interchange protein DsbD
MKNIRLFFLLLLTYPLIAQPQPDPELLEPDKAFAFGASAGDDNTIRAEWDIADGYYLYRDHIRFRSATPGIQLGDPLLPAGEPRDDEFFGRIQTYRGHVSAEIPVERDPGAPETFQLIALSQGCADIGVCYPPHTQSTMISLADVVQPEESSDTVAALDSLKDLGKGIGIGSGADEFLDPDVAFRLGAEAESPDLLVARWSIAKGYYLYRDKFTFDVEKGDGITLLPAELPAADIKEDEFFGRMEVYHNDIEVRIPIERSSPATTDLELRVGYQGCAEAGICYPPIKKLVRVALPPPGEALAAGTGRAASGPSAIATIPPQDDIARILTESSLGWVILFFFGAGTLLAFTACMYPMIPILSSIIVGQGKEITTMKAFMLSLVYVEAMAVTYALIGIASAHAGAGVQGFFQNPWILGLFALIFVALALSMFGFYNLQIPASWQTRLSEASHRQRGGTLAGVGVMGILSALIIGPCAGPVLIGALAYTSQSGDFLTGGLAMFALGNGMGAPLLLIGTSGGKLLPKAGPWMDTIKAVFGVILLGVAVLMLERILPGPVILLLWAMLLIVSAIYMGALDSIASGASGWRKLWKGFGIVMLAWGILLVIGSATGGRDPFQPIRSAMTGTGVTEEGSHVSALPFQRVKSVTDLERNLAASKAQGRFAMLDFYADWCTYCIKMEDYTFSDPRVREAMTEMTLLQADVTANDETDLALLNHFRLFAPPAILFFGPDGQELENFRVVGFLDPDRFLEHLEAVTGSAGADRPP